MENILSYIWRYNMLKGIKLSLSDGTPVEVTSPGIDKEGNLIFSDAIVRVEDTPSKMRVAIAPASPQGCDLYVTQQQEKECDDYYILHLNLSDNLEVLRKSLLSKFEELPCADYFKTLPQIFITDLFTSLAIRRLEGKSERVLEWLKLHNNDWEEVCYISLARSLGFGVNGTPFENMANSLPLKFLQKHADSLFQIEAMLFGAGGFLDDEKSAADQYHKRLINEWNFLKNKFSLKSNDIKCWKFSGMRPSNFPHQRIAMLAALIHSSLPIFTKFTDAKEDGDIRKVFEVYPCDYWDTHYTFGVETPPLRKTLGRSAVDLLIINSVAPLLYAYSTYTKNENFASRAISLLEECRAENNAIIRRFTDNGLTCKSALASQALITLNSDYCTPRNCLGCRIGYQIFKEEVKRSVRSF